jgi:hypothetical protein
MSSSSSASTGSSRRSASFSSSAASALVYKSESKVPLAAAPRPTRPRTERLCCPACAAVFFDGALMPALCCAGSAAALLCGSSDAGQARAEERARCWRESIHAHTAHVSTPSEPFVLPSASPNQAPTPLAMSSFRCRLVRQTAASKPRRAAEQSVSEGGCFHPTFTMSSAAAADAPAAPAPAAASEEFYLRY